MKIIFGDVAKLLAPFIKYLIKYIKDIVRYYYVFYNGFRYADNFVENLPIDTDYVNAISNISSEPYNDLKTIVCREYIRKELNMDKIYRDVFINTLIEIIYFYRKLSSNK